MTYAGGSRIRNVLNQADRTLHSPWLIGAIALLALMAIAVAGLAASSVQHVTATGDDIATAAWRDMSRIDGQMTGQGISCGNMCDFPVIS